MQRIRIRSSVVIGAIVCLAADAWALDPSLDVNQYAHTAWRLSGGALAGHPKTLAQTTDGYIWLGTDFGLVRFDGVRFTPWNPPAGTALPSTVIVKLVAARDGSLWIGTVSGLARLKDGRLTPYGDLAGRYVTAIAEDRGGTIWVGTNGGVNGTARLCAIDRARVKCEQDPSLGRFVISLYEDTRGTLWVGAAAGLWRWKPGPRTLHTLAAPFAEIPAVAEDERGSVIVAANRQVSRLGASGFETLPLAGAVRPVKPTALLRDREGSLWIGTQDQGIVHVHTGRVDRFTRRDGLSGDFVTSIFEDAEGNVWVATLTGLDRFRAVAVSTIGMPQGLSANTVLSVLAARDASVWVGTIGGLNRWADGGVVRHRLPRAFHREGVASLFEDRRGRLWVSSSRGLVFFEPGASTPRKVLPRAYIHAMAEDEAENLWVSDQERGLLRLHGGKVVESFPWQALGGRNARTLAVDPSDGGLWLGFFDHGLAYFKNGRIQASFTTADGLGAGQVSHVRFDSDRALWVATEGGVSRVKDRSIRTLGTANGLPCDGIRWTADDHDGSLWVYSTCALVRLPRRQIDAWLADPSRRLQMAQYDRSDGVPTNWQVSAYSPTVTKTGDGRLWFASYEGLASVDPRRLPFNMVVPPVHIEYITVDERTQPASAVSRLPPRTRDLRIDYTATSLSAPEKIRFRYRLEGKDDKWVEAGSRRQAFYSDLPPGHYRFRVIASNNNGVWNSEGAVWSVVIEPALHQTLAFKIVATLAVLIGCWSLYRVRIGRLAAQLNVRFEERLGERTRIAQELHDTLLQGVVSASMQLHVLADEIGDARIRAKLEHVLGRLHQVSGEGRETIQALRTATDKLDDLGLALARDAEELRGEQPIEIHVVVGGRRQRVHPLIWDDVYRIAREALVNTFRHASARHVEIQLEYSPDCLRVSVRDDGCGIEPLIAEAGRPGHWGILGMRERAERIDAAFKLFSAPGAGTEIEVLVPGHIAFQKPAARRRVRWFRRHERTSAGVM